MTTPALLTQLRSLRSDITLGHRSSALSIIDTLTYDLSAEAEAPPAAIPAVGGPDRNEKLDPAALLGRPDDGWTL